MPRGQLPRSTKSYRGIDYADPWTRYGRILTKAEWAELVAIKDGVCRLCERSDQKLVYEHDHSIGRHACRGWTCQRCNSHMTGIDAGRYAIDFATRQFLIEPWHLTRVGKRLEYEPVVSTSVSKLSSADRYVVNKLSWEFGDNDYSMRRAQPRFEHEGIAALIEHEDFRPVLRLRYLNIRGLVDLDISRPDDRLSSFQRLHLPNLVSAPMDPWSHIATDVV